MYLVRRYDVLSVNGVHGLSGGSAGYSQSQRAHLSPLISTTMRGTFTIRN